MRNAVQKIENITLFPDVSLYGSHFRFFFCSFTQTLISHFARSLAIVNISLSWSFFFIIVFLIFFVPLLLPPSIYTADIWRNVDRQNDQKTVYSFLVYECLCLFHTQNVQAFTHTHTHTAHAYIIHAVCLVRMVSSSSVLIKRVNLIKLNAFFSFFPYSLNFLN